MNTLAAFIRRNRQRIVDDWYETVRELPSSHALPPEVVRNHIPEFLERLADAVESHDSTALLLRGLPNLHAALRVREGYDLRQVIAEYRTLRSVIGRLYCQEGDISEASRPKLGPLSVMNAALDLAIADAVDQYSIDYGKAREMFIGMLGHDLREPLSAIAFAAGTLWDRRDELDARTVKTVARIAASARRMDRMIRDLLDFARGRLSGGFPIVPAPIDARTVIADTVSEIAQAHPARAIECRVAGPGDFHVRWDGDRVAQAIANLVSNAVVHGTDPVVIEPADQRDWIKIEVRNGGEIPPQILPKIFAPFTQPGTDRRHDGEHKGPERRRGHLGLGLFIVREVATAHGGRVTAESRDGLTTFTMMLPRDARTAEAPPAA